MNCEKCALVGQCQENCEVTCQECDQVSVILIEPEANRTEMLTDDLTIFIDAVGTNCNHMKAYVNDSLVWTSGGNSLSYSYPVKNAGTYKIQVTGTSRTGKKASSGTRTVTVEETCTISYSINGGIGVAPEPQTVICGSEVILPALEHPRDCCKLDHTFDGWNTCPDGAGDLYEQGQKVRFYSDTTLYAQFTYAID